MGWLRRRLPDRAQEDIISANVRNADTCRSCRSCTCARNRRNEPEGFCPMFFTHNTTVMLRPRAAPYTRKKLNRCAAVYIAHRNEGCDGSKVM